MRHDSVQVETSWQFAALRLLLLESGDSTNRDEKNSAVHLLRRKSFQTFDKQVAFRAQTPCVGANIIFLAIQWQMIDLPWTRPFPSLRRNSLYMCASVPVSDSRTHTYVNTAGEAKGEKKSAREHH